MRRGYKPKPWQTVTMELARLRAWLKFIRDENPKYAEAVVDIALNTDHWPNETRLCIACGWPASKTELVCVNCKAEAQDYRDELEERAVPHRGY